MQFEDKEKLVIKKLASSTGQQMCDHLYHTVIANILI